MLTGGQVRITGLVREGRISIVSGESESARGSGWPAGSTPVFRKTIGRAEP